MLGARHCGYVCSLCHFILNVVTAAVTGHEGTASHQEAVRCSASKDDLSLVLSHKKTKELLMVETCMAAMYW